MIQAPPERTAAAAPPTMDRRALLAGAAAVTAGALGIAAYRRSQRPRAAVFLARGQRYDNGLERTIEDGLHAVGLNLAELQQKRVLLKPNLVEPDRRCPQMTTHPAIIVATAEVFRRYGATVVVGEGPGHVRDTDMILDESGVGESLHMARLEYVDLNYDEVGEVANRGRASRLDKFFLPRTVMEADLVVSLPKLKTHHWVGMTAACKNLYGLLPGCKYGWPKNVLHHAGIPETVHDINASVPRTITVVDAIDCMEGDGPIMGSLKRVGVVAIGLNPTAVDATCARLMGLDPAKISYLQLAADRLGPLAADRIEQRGEAWANLSTPFHILDRPHLQQLRMNSGVLTS
ncbi:MAG: DUF362 domain-containing protein [Pirellulales bacterium]